VHICVLKYGQFNAYLVHLCENIWELDSQTLSLHFDVFIRDSTVNYSCIYRRTWYYCLVQYLFMCRRFTMFVCSFNVCYMFLRTSLCVSYIRILYVFTFQRFMYSLQDICLVVRSSFIATDRYSSVSIFKT